MAPPVLKVVGMPPALKDGTPPRVVMCGLSAVPIRAVKAPHRQDAALRNPRAAQVAAGAAAKAVHLVLRDRDASRADLSEAELKRPLQRGLFFGGQQRVRSEAIGPWGPSFGTAPINQA